MASPARQDFEALSAALKDLDHRSGHRIALIGGVAITYRPSRRERLTDALYELVGFAAWGIQPIALLAAAGLLVANIGGDSVLTLLACALMLTAMLHVAGALVQGVGVRFNPLPAAAGAVIVTALMLAELALGTVPAVRDVTGGLLGACAAAAVLAWINEFSH